MSESSKVIHFLELQKRAAEVGIMLIASDDHFSIENDANNEDFIIFFYELDHVQQFICGYELGYASSLNTQPT